MNHFEKIAVQLESYGLDAILLTGEANRFYATGFHSMGTDGAALITRKKNYYFTDARYTEAAGRCIQNAQLRETGHGHSSAPCSGRFSIPSTVVGCRMRVTSPTK